MFKKEKTREQKKENIGIANIYASYNNTIIHITDLLGNTIAKVSGGQVTKHDRLKANPTVAMFAAKKASELARDYGINSLYVKIKGKGGPLSPSPGPGAHAAIKSLARSGMKILNIIDVTPIPRGGPKPKGGRRGRRV